jgi:hypothetical protein
VHQPENPVLMRPDPYDPSQAAFNFPVDHGQIDFPNAHSPSLGQLELMNGGWNEHHHHTRRTVTGGDNAYEGGFNEFRVYGAASNYPGPSHPDYLRSLGVNIGGWDYGSRFGMGVAVGTNENQVNDID